MITPSRRRAQRALFWGTPLLVIAALTLSGCGTSSADTVESLRDMYVDADGTCEGFKVSEDIGPWKETGNCGIDGKVLMIFDGEEQRDDAIATLKNVAEENREQYDSMSGMKGPNWIIYPSSVDERDIAMALDATFFSIDESL